MIISGESLQAPVGHLRGEQFFYENNSKGIPTVKILRYFTGKAP